MALGLLRMTPSRQCGCVNPVMIAVGLESKVGERIAAGPKSRLLQTRSVVSAEMFWGARHRGSR